jgi:hypothetical protein
MHANHAVRTGRQAGRQAGKQTREVDEEGILGVRAALPSAVTATRAFLLLREIFTGIHMARMHGECFSKEPRAE